jgi:hypothetical protein
MSRSSIPAWAAFPADLARGSACAESLRCDSRLIYMWKGGVSRSFVGIVRREVQALTRHTLPRTPPFFPFLPQNTNPGARVDGPIHRRCLPLHSIAAQMQARHDKMDHRYPCHGTHPSPTSWCPGPFSDCPSPGRGWRIDHITAKEGKSTPTTPVSGQGL